MLSSALTKADALLRQGDYAKAEPLIRQHLRSKPDDAQAHEWLGASLMFQRRYDQAKFSALRSLELSARSASPQALSNRYELLANIYAKLGDRELSLHNARLAVQAAPTPSALNVLAAMHLLREEPGLAFDPLSKAYALRSDDLSIASNYALLLGDLGHPERAIAVLLKALRTFRDPQTFTAVIPGLHYPVPTQPKPAQATIEDPLPASPDDPHTIDPLFKLRFAKQYGDFVAQLAREELAGKPHLHAITDFSPSRPLRVGILSYDMRRHSCSYFLRPLCKHLRRDDLTLIGLYTSSQVDSVTDELRAGFDEWLHIPGLTIPEVAREIARARIDVLIECGGYTVNSAMQACAISPAPVQATYLGYPGTTGLHAMHYRLVDASTDPAPIADTHCTEQLIRLPQCFLCFDPGPDCPEPRSESVLGPVDALGADGSLRPLVFGSFSTAIKLSQATYDQWCAVLRAVPRSTMLIKASILGTQEARDHALNQFAQRGIDPARIELIARVPDQRAHLRIYDRMDIALDTYPYVGTTTICESLLMGVPYLSRYGSQHVNRVGLSLLSAVGVPELACPTIDALVAKALELDRNRPALARYQRTLRHTMLRSPVGDAKAFADRFASAVRFMWQQRASVLAASGA
jgi:Tfp pilus assembly protein PilF